jgi:hypothetical protein
MDRVQVNSFDTAFSCTMRLVLMAIHAGWLMDIVIFLSLKKTAR